MADVQELLRLALTRVVEASSPPWLSSLDDDTNVFDLIDSFSVVNLILETEMMMEEATGNYVALANEDIFDAQKSPLRKWSDWVAYVVSCHE